MMSFILLPFYGVLSIVNAALFLYYEPREQSSGSQDPNKNTNANKNRGFAWWSRRMGLLCGIVFTVAIIDPFGYAGFYSRLTAIILTTIAVSLGLGLTSVWIHFYIAATYSIVRKPYPDTIRYTVLLLPILFFALTFPLNVYSHAADRRLLYLISTLVFCGTGFAYMTVAIIIGVTLKARLMEFVRSVSPAPPSPSAAVTTSTTPASTSPTNAGSGGMVVDVSHIYASVRALTFAVTTGSAVTVIVCGVDLFLTVPSVMACDLNTRLAANAAYTPRDVPNARNGDYVPGFDASVVIIAVLPLFMLGLFAWLARPRSIRSATSSTATSPAGAKAVAQNDTPATKTIVTEILPVSPKIANKYGVNSPTNAPLTNTPPLNGAGKHVIVAFQ